MRSFPTKCFIEHNMLIPVLSTMIYHLFDQIFLSKIAVEKCIATSMFGWLSSVSEDVLKYTLIEAYRGKSYLRSATFARQSLSTPSELLDKVSSSRQHRDIPTTRPIALFLLRTAYARRSLLSANTRNYDWPRWRRRSPRLAAAHVCICSS